VIAGREKGGKKKREGFALFFVLIAPGGRTEKLGKMMSSDLPAVRRRKRGRGGL